MFRYYLTLGFRNLRRNPALTALMVLTLAVGIAACMSTLTVLYVMSGDPIPTKSDRLFVPQLDIYPATYQPRKGKDDEPDEQMTYKDAVNLLAGGQGVHRAAMYGIGAGLESGRKDLPPMEVDGLATSADFFAMFDVPFLRGGPWGKAQDDAKAPVMVLSKGMAEKVFGTIDPVGKRVRMAETEFQVIGVLDEWKPLPRYYRLINGNGGSFSGEDQVFIPFATAVQLEMGNNGNNNCSGDSAAPGWQGWLDSECTWIQFWFEGKTGADQKVLHDYLDAYTAEQKKLNRMPRPLNNRLRNVREWMEFREVVGKDSKLSTWLSFGFLLVCLVNTIGLLLAKFSARAGEVGVRRALGAPRSEIFRQYLTEAAVVGLVGGALGLVLSFGGLWLIALQSDAMAAVAKMDWVMLLTTIGLSLLASVIAGLLPTWRACQVTPALQLKSQ
ncbi:MAG: ABC transporter permease [Arenimonas sp.]